MYPTPKYSESLSIIENQKPLLIGAGNYAPYAVKCPEKSQDLPSVLGVYQCGDCIGIVGWDKTSKATFIYHMNEFDERRMAIGLGNFIIAMLESQGDASQSPNVKSLKAHMECLEKKYFNYEGEVNNVIEAILGFNMLGNTNFTLVSNHTRSVDVLTNFLTNRINLQENQLSVDAPQNFPNSNGAQLAIDRDSGEICKDFSYNPDSGITYTQSSAKQAGSSSSAANSSKPKI